MVNNDEKVSHIIQDDDDDVITSSVEKVVERMLLRHQLILTVLRVIALSLT